MSSPTSGPSSGPSDGVAPTIARISVLVVDDLPDLLDLFVLILTLDGARVSTAASVGEAFDSIRSHPPDILVSDLTMPEADGFELIRRVRELPPERGRAIPAIAVTAHTRDHHRARVLEAGFQAFLPEPVEADTLVAVIARLVGRG